MRPFLPSRLIPTRHAALKLISRGSAARPCSDPTACLTNCRCFAQVHDVDRINREVWFTSAAPRLNGLGLQNDHQPPDERTLQLGKTVRILHDRLPTLLQSPLPGDILSPQITLHLFPSTHPHLPTVSGKIAYNAALWTAPVAWGRLPLVGNVKLTILSERMMRHGGSAVPLASRDEKLIVKWKTCGKTKHRDPTGGIYRGATGMASKDPMDRIRERINGQDEEFCGLFLFEFDEKGRIVKHIIEHTDEGGHWDKTARVVSVTDWLLGRFHGRSREPVPQLAYCEERPTGGRIRLVDRSRRAV
ncbi:hypothetical protein BAUCODRAFT_69839 [Baudoinia panamericana UAMH 10762]|uniref:Uncharacterized protein n=1 Tax=Baudoinia panamericana (strain UAMH 10762) TaxID=717646 RepID=M2NAH0_BAUPA|nr:uncharacterized protein BAUCODRAFT_69839 [Baudoinia panamericana UAMH 10762]EMC96129.1 hypothetical protein BAUCODRAFT_69839 [Baudoinia panamericana UAMH 10762]